LPLLILIYPFYPQLGPQEFFIFQKSFLIPTKRTPWFKLVLQELRIPYLYGAQFDASTATEIGFCNNIFVKAAHPDTTPYPDILNDPVLYKHVPLTPLYG
jgi:hypothetical protein